MYEDTGISEFIQRYNVSIHICMKRSHRGGGSWNEWWAFRVQTGGLR